MAAYVVTRTLQYAWLEYQDLRDGIALDRAMSGYGWKNLLERLAPVTRSVNKTDFMDLGHPDLRVNYRGLGQTGLIATPREAHAEFLEEWLINPGVENFRLSAKILAPEDTDTTAQADLLVISGHGENAAVAGDIEDKKEIAHLAVGQAFIKYAKTPTSGRLKYLLIAACNDANARYDVVWYHALMRANPVHGILGFSEAYPGDESGAAIMTKFARALHDGGDKSVLQAWKEANTHWSWSAVMRESSATEDTLARWTSEKGLPAPTGRVLHYSSASPAGVMVPPYPQIFEAFFVMFEKDDEKKPVEIRFANNIQYRVGLIQGKRGQLVVRRNDGQSFAAGDVVRVVFARYRFDRLEMDLNTLLRFDEGAPVTLVEDGNKDKPAKTRKKDAVDIKFSAPSTQMKIGYTIRPDAARHYDGSLGTHGLFITRTLHPNANPSIKTEGFDSADGAHLLER